MKKIIISAIMAIAAVTASQAGNIISGNTAETSAAEVKTEKKEKAEKPKKPVKYNEKGEIIKTGLNYGPLPAISFSTDLGFQFGALLNIYNYGDGSTYPEPKSHWYIEGSAYLKEKKVGTQTYVVSYDNRKLTPNYNMRMCAAATLNHYTGLDFYGFNGYQAQYHPEDPKRTDPLQFKSGFYRHRRTTLTAKADFIGEILPNFFWEAGYHFTWYQIGQFKDYTSQTDPEGNHLMSLYDYYMAWGIIPENQTGDQFSSAIRAGLVYDTRDVEASPSRGIWAEGHFIAAPKFFGSSNEYYKFNVTFRHYVPIWKDKLVFAYRLSYQGFLGKNVPWYVMPYYTVVGPLYDRDGIGGYRTSRGIAYNRVQGRHTAFFNAEFRYRFIDFKLWNQNIAFAVSALCDGAMVTVPFDNSYRPAAGSPELETAYKYHIDPTKKDYPHIAAGGGLRFIMNRNFIVAVEYAHPINRQDQKGGSFYINTGFLF